MIDDTTPIRWLCSDVVSFTIGDEASSAAKRSPRMVFEPLLLPRGTSQALEEIRSTYSPLVLINMNSVDLHTSIPYRDWRFLCKVGSRILETQPTISSFSFPRSF